MSEMSDPFAMNQVLFARYKDLWYPAVAIDADDTETWTIELPPRKPGFQHILWLGSGKVSLIDNSQLKDFCTEFHECTAKNKINKDAKYVLAISLAVKLAAVRNGHANPENNWLSWGQKNLKKNAPLMVTTAFYKAVVPSGIQVEDTPDESPRKPPTPIGQDIRRGQFVWVKVGLSDDHWPALVMDETWWPPKKVGVVVLTKDAKKFDVKASDVHDFCKNFVLKLNSHKLVEDRDFKRAVKLAAKNIRKILTEEEIEDKDYDYIGWARKNLPLQNSIVASEDVQEFCFLKYPPGKGVYTPLTEEEKKLAGFRGSTPEDPKQTPDRPTGRLMKAVKSIKKRQHSEKGMTGLPSLKKVKQEDGDESMGTLDSGLSQIELDELNRKREEKARRKAEKKKQRELEESTDSLTPKPLKKKRGPSFGKRGNLTEEDMMDLKVPLDQGWERILIFRKTETASGKKGDVYYKPPDGSKRLRSNPEIIKYFEKVGQETDLIPGKHFNFKDVPVDHPKQIVQE